MDKTPSFSSDRQACARHMQSLAAHHAQEARLRVVNGFSGNAAVVAQLLSEAYYSAARTLLGIGD